MKGILRIILLELLFLYAAMPVAAAISLQVKDAEVRDLLVSLADLSGSDIVLDDSVQGKISLRIDEIEPETAIDLISRLKGLAYERQGNAIVIGSRRSLIRNFSELHVFPIAFADWESVKKAIDLSLGEAGFAEEKTNKENRAKDSSEKDMTVSESGRRFFLDREANQVLFYGTAAEAVLVEKALRALDVPGKQVSLEARVIAVQKDAARKLGIEWEWSKLPQYPEYTTEYESVKHSVENADGSYTTVTEDVPKTTVHRSWAAGASVPGVLQFGHGPEGKPFEFYYAANLSALVTEGKANILARPNIMTIQGREAVINIGGEVPVPTVSTTNATTTTSIEYRKAGIILRYTPRVNADGYITATVHTEVSSPLYVEELKAYRFQQRSADTTVRLKDGETMVIGGLIGSEEARSLSKVPFLGDLPVLGQFFRCQRNSKTESEILIFLTAHVVR